MQSLHLLQPLSLQTKAAANAIAAFDLPEPGGPVNNQVFVIPCVKSSLFRADCTASLSIATTSD
jgi:hypothetical protein